MTFDPLPGQLREPRNCDLLTTLPERLDRFRELGVVGDYRHSIRRRLHADVSGGFHQDVSHESDAALPLGRAGLQIGSGA